MGVIHWRLKNIFFISLFLLALFTVFKLHPHASLNGVAELVYGDPDNEHCNKKITFVDTSKLGKKWPLIGLLGPPGSGVVWLRYLIEQLTGLHTGSLQTEYPKLFPAEGKTRNVVVVMSHDAAPNRHMAAGIVVYRNLQETVRSQFATHVGIPGSLEPPMDAYYAGSDWETFAASEGTAWADRYRDYIQLGMPLLVINFADLEDPQQLKKQLLHISHFLHVPIRHSVLDCLVDRGAEAAAAAQYRPRTLRYGFHPLELLPTDKQTLLENHHNYTDTMIAKVKAAFLPKVHM